MLLPRQRSKLERGAKEQGARVVSEPKHRDAVISIDIGKNSFHVVWLDCRGVIVLHCIEISYEIDAMGPFATGSSQ